MIDFFSASSFIMQSTTFFDAKTPKYRFWRPLLNGINNKIVLDIPRILYHTILYQKGAAHHTAGAAVGSANLKRWEVSG